MSLKRDVHALIDDLPDDSPVLVDFCETLKLNAALSEAMADIREGRVYSSDEFMAKVNQRWPQASSE